MRTVLHILTRPEDALARAVIGCQASEPDLAVEVVDLTQPRPDYDALVEKIFAADSVGVW
jgi:hypothetical protein